MAVFDLFRLRFLPVMTRICKSLQRTQLILSISLSASVMALSAGGFPTMTMHFRGRPELSEVFTNRNNLKVFPTHPPTPYSVARKC